MATQTAKNYMRAEAQKRLQAAIVALAEKYGLEPIVVTEQYRDKDLEQIKFTERIADFVESLLTIDLVPAEAAEPAQPKTETDDGTRNRKNTRK